MPDGLELPFFDRYGDTLYAADGAELARKLDKIARLAPPRFLGRKGRYEERFCIDIYLRYLARHSLLFYPIEVIKTESPDFMIAYGKGSVGLEVTNASPELFEHVVEEAAKHHPRTSLESDILEIDSLVERTAEESEQFAGSPEEHFRPDSQKLDESTRAFSSTTSSTEKVWVELVVAAIIKKMLRLNHKPAYAQADVYELLIYDNTHLGGELDVDKALPLLKQAIENEKRRLEETKKCFDRISVTHGSGLLYDVEAC